MANQIEEFYKGSEEPEPTEEEKNCTAQMPYLAAQRFKLLPNENVAQ